MIRRPSPELLAGRAEVEANMAALLGSHGHARATCQGYHPRRPRVVARFVVEFRPDPADKVAGRRIVQAACARCAYGLDALDIVGRLPIRYP